MDEAGKRVDAVVDELSAVDLGDSRLNFRARHVGARLGQSPGLSFPAALATEAELEGFYRFLANDRVTAKAILRPHAQATVARAGEHGTVLAIHDTTEFQFAGEGREDLGIVNRDGCKLFAHLSLLVSADGNRDPLGVLATETWSRDGKPTRSSLRKRGVSSAATLAMPSEYARWRRGIEEAEKQVAGQASLIHVMDSESDDYSLICHMQEKNRRYVLRACRNRKLDSAATGSLPGEKADQFMARAETRALREVKLSRRKTAEGRALKAKRIESRSERTALLAFSAETIVVMRPELASKELPATMRVNVVSVRELNAPDGMEPVDWQLFTNEPIGTDEQILAVVDFYRARWIIEEYFKALKTGCAFEKRQLESKDTIDKALALFTPVAWALLRMRTASRSKVKQLILTVLSLAQIAILKNQTGIPLRKNSSAAEAYLAIARLGGHIKNNGAPGWQVLGRGYLKLLTLEVGYKIAKNETCDR